MYLSSLFVWCTSATFRVSQASQMPEIDRVFATDTIYWDQRNLTDTTAQTSFQLELELIQTQTVGCHGIRYPTSKIINGIEALLEKLKVFETSLPEWMQNYTLPYNLSVQGKLVDEGERELRELGARCLTRNGYDGPQVCSKENYSVAHTHVMRARDSAIAFASSFSANAKDVEYIEYSQDEDVLLRFFDQCARYQREVKQNQTAQEQRDAFQNSSVMTENAQWLKQSLGLTNERIDFSAKDVMSVQSACAFDIALYHREHHWCTLISETFMRSLDYLDDIEQYYCLGGGFVINYEMAAVLLREIFSLMKAKAQGNSTLSGIFRFAHAETTLPLMTLLGYGDRSPLLANATDAAIASRGFRTSILSPFAANIEFRLFQQKTSHEFFVQILVNEKELPIPGCERVFCELSELENLWRYYLETYDFHTDCQ